MDIPVVETSRLILRGQTLEDFPSYAAMWREPAVTRFIGGVPLTEEEAWSKFLRMAGHWALQGFGFWTIVEKSSGKRIGEAGILNVKRDMQPSFHGVPEIGWGLHPSVHGKGYATEAVGAIIAWAEQHFGKVRMVCIIHPDNAPSLAVAHRTGFREQTRSTYKDEPIVLLERVP
jgi:RimJ/RimL family protein N-acetyltransferase